jgi:two-component system chemotaxis sensor kinase CheA
MQNTESHSDWKRRGEAAEKTADVLKKRVRSLYNEGAQTAIHRQLERAREREEEQRRKRDVMSARNAELQRNSAVLEETVARRTADLKAILDNVTFGFIVIDADCKVMPGFTRSCEALLGRTFEAGADACELLGMVGTTSEPMFRMGIEQAFEDFMPEEVTVEQLPKSFVVDERRLNADCRAIRETSGAVENVLVTISDVTALFEAERRAHRNAALVGILRQKSAFAAFVSDAKGRIAACRESIEDQPFIRRSIHTIKGNAASYGLFDVASTANQVEERTEIRIEEVNVVEGVLDTFLTEHIDVLGSDLANGADSVEVGSDELDVLRRILDPIDPSALQAWGQSVIQRPVSELVGPLDEFVARVAEKVERNVEFRAEGLDVKVDPKIMQPIVSTMTHMIRNALDHGIEPESQRGDKPAAGQLIARFESSEDSWSVEVRDDGCGIDTDKLLAKALERGDLTEQAAADLGPKERLELIFLDGLSSREVATSLSGRGVGMSAVREAVELQGGSIAIESTIGEGTRFRIEVPKASAV